MRNKAAVTLDPNRRCNDAVEFERALGKKIVGQDQAVSTISEIYQTMVAGLNPPGRPIGNLLFLGPTGCGKTRVAEAMAEALYGDANALVRIDCAEFQHSHEIAKLIGSPPGYLGHRETHPLLCQETLDRVHTEKVKLTILLFDEIEKASDSLWQLLLGILDKAALTLGDNTRVDLSRCVIIMTSNLGAREMAKMMDCGLGFQHNTAAISGNCDEKIDRTARDAARRNFTPEFMNRLDKVVVFRTLRSEHLKQILEIELGRVQQRILNGSGESKFVFVCTPAVKDFLLREGWDVQYGARHLKRAIERHLVASFANLMASAQVRLGDVIRIDLKSDGQLSFMKEQEGASKASEWSGYFTIPPMSRVAVGAAM